MTDQVAVKETPPVKKEKTKREMTKWEWTWHEMKRTKTGYYMVLPFFVSFIAFTAIPVILSILLSFTSFDMLRMPRFIFMDNYIRMFLDDDLFLIAFKNTLMFAAIIGPSSFILSFVLAWFINELSPKMRAFVTIIFYAPSIAGSTTLIWTMLFQESMYGYVNGWLLQLGLITEPILFFSNAETLIPLIIITSLWSSLGMAFLSFIAGLQGIDRHIIEAGAVDGIKNRWQELWYITLPSMKPMLMFGSILSITGGFGFSNGLSSATVDNYCAYTLTNHLAEYSGTRFEFGYASALSLVLFFLMMGSNMAVQKLLSRVGT